MPARAAVWMQIVKTGEARDTGAPDQPFFVLALGTGARSDNPADSPDDPGLSDAIHVIAVNPALGAATILDIPRDTEGPGGSKLNSYIVSSGSENLRAAANAVSSVVGVQLPMVVRVNFPHFQQMVDAIGGIDINIPTAMDDDFSGAHFSPGPTHLNGEAGARVLPRPALVRERRPQPVEQPGAADPRGVVDAAGEEPERRRHRAPRRAGGPSREARRRGHLRPVPHGPARALRSIPPTSRT